MKTRNHSFKIGVWKAQAIKGETAVAQIDLQSNTCNYLWRSRYGFVFDGKHKKGGNSSVAYSSGPTRACPLFFSVTSVVAWGVFNPWQPFKSPCPCFQFIWSDTYFQKIIPSWKYHPKLDGWMISKDIRICATCILLLICTIVKQLLEYWISSPSETLGLSAHKRWFHYTEKLMTSPFQYVHIHILQWINKTITFLIFSPVLPLVFFANGYLPLVH